MGNVDVLLVEDDDALRQALAECLRETSGLAVDGARDGVEALHKLSRRRYAAVILDLMMPKMSGTDVLDSLAILETGSAGPPPAVVVITSMTESDVPAALLRQRSALVHAIFRKPFDVRDVADALLRLVGDRTS